MMAQQRLDAIAAAPGVRALLASATSWMCCCLLGFSSHSGDFVDCNALQEQFLQLARDGMREARAGKGGSQGKKDGAAVRDNVVAIRRGAPFQLGVDCINPDNPGLRGLPYPCGAKQRC